MVSLNLDVNGKGYCKTCSRRPNKYYLLDEKLLPIWYKDGQPMYHIPTELLRLSHAEKMLIQRVSPFVPLHHIKQGVFGLSVHVCAFEQEMGDLAMTLPRHGKDTSVIRVLQEIRTEIGSDSPSRSKAFWVRKEYVLSALYFLKEYNTEYSDIEIDPTRLDWISGSDGVLINTKDRLPMI